MTRIGHRIFGLVCAVVLMVTAASYPVMAATAPLTVEDRLNALEDRVTQLEKALTLSTFDVVGLVEKAAPAVVSIYNTDNQDNVQSQGTGFIIDANGIILTNAHVVDDDTLKIKVKFSNGKVVPAQRQLFDPWLDMALLKIDGTGYPTLPFATAKPKAGDPVVVIGNAWGYSNSVTFGIISGVDRPDPYHMHHYPSLQTDAAINHGNSGGPLLNARGEVVAMATWGELKGQTEGIAFGIPIDQIQAAMARVQKDRGVVRPWLGVSAREPYWSRGGLPNADGLLVTGVRAGSAAAAGGLRRGDWITSVNGVPVNYLDDLRQELEKYRPGTVITLGIDRENAQQTDWVPTTVSLTLGEFSAAVPQQIPWEYAPDTDDLF